MLAERLGIGKESLKDLLSLFIESTREDLKELKESIKNKDYSRIASLAHHIRGAAVNLDLSDTAILTEKLRASALSEDQDKLDELFQDLKREIDALSVNLPI
jgi:HPt (histidine-containing phosphotransfer) domain-containing protein